MPKLCTSDTIPLTPVPSPPMGRGESIFFDYRPLPRGESARRAGEGVKPTEQGSCGNRLAFNLGKKSRVAENLWSNRNSLLEKRNRHGLMD